MELDIGRGEGRVGAHEDAELARRHGHRPASGEKELRGNRSLAQQAVRHFVERARTGDTEHRSDLQVILQVFTHAAQRVHGLDTEPAEAFGQADPR